MADLTENELIGEKSRAAGMVIEAVTTGASALRGRGLGVSTPGGPLSHPRCEEGMDVLCAFARVDWRPSAVWDCCRTGVRQEVGQGHPDGPVGCVG